MGEKEKAEDCLNKLFLRQEQEPETSLNMDIAVVYAGIGNIDKVFEYLNKAFEERSGGILFIRNPNWEAIHNDPRYHELIKKMGWKE